MSPPSRGSARHRKLPLCILVAAAALVAASSSLEATPPRTSAEYRRRRAGIDHTNADALWRLARWSNKRDLYEEEKEALGLTLMADPGHSRAREALQEILNQEAAHRDWRTPWRREANFVYVETNTTRARLHHFCDSVTAFYKRFGRIFSIRTTPLRAWGRKIGVKVFRTREDFVRYQQKSGGQLGESTVGYYSLTHKELVLFDDPDNPEETLDTLFHEGTHLFVNLALGDDRYLPLWLDEGLAEYFGPSRLDSDRLDIDYGRPSPERLRTSREVLAAQPPSLASLISHSDPETFEAHHYALSWSLVHMLIEKRAEGSDDPAHRQAFLAYFGDVAGGADPRASFVRRFGPVKAMQQEWWRYIEKFPRSLRDDGLALLRRGDTAAAAELLERHCRENPEDAEAHYHLGDADYELDRFEEAATAYRTSIRLAPDNAEAHGSLALALCKLGKTREAVRRAKRGVTVSPNPRSYYYLAFCHKENGNKADALRALEAAARLGSQGPVFKSLRRNIEAMR